MTPEDQLRGRGAIRRGWQRASKLEATLIVLLLLCLAPAAGIVASRIGANFDVATTAYQHMAMIDQILQGKQLYAPLSTEHSSVTYTPLYWYLSAALCKLLGVSFLWPRLVSLLAGLGCAAVVFLWAQRLTKQDLLLSVSAVVMVLCTAYQRHITFWLLDINVNALHVVLAVLGFYLLIDPTRPKAAAAAIALSACVLAKQTGLAYVAAAAVMLLVRNRRCLGVFVAVCTLLIGAGVWYLEVFDGQFLKQTVAANQGPPWILDRLFEEVLKQQVFGLAGVLVLLTLLGLLLDDADEPGGFFRRIWQSEYVLAGAGLAVEMISHPKYGSGPTHVIVAMVGLTLCGIKGLARLKKALAPSVAQRVAACVVILQVSLMLIVPSTYIPQMFFDQHDAAQEDNIGRIFAAGRTCFFGVTYIQRHHGQPAAGIPDDEPSKFVDGRLTYEFIPDSVIKPFADQLFDYIIVGSYFDPNHPVVKAILKNYTNCIAQFPAHPQYPNSESMRFNLYVLKANRLQ